MKISALILTFLLTLLSHADCLNPNQLNCNFYRNCVETKKSCGSQGYAIGYGERYCNEFLNRQDFSPKGIKWRNSTLICLQQQLVHILAADSNWLTCERITDLAFMSHAFCYTRGEVSVCDLGVKDLYILYSVIDNADLLSARGLAQIKEVAEICLNSIRNDNKLLMTEKQERIQFWTNIYERH